MDEDAPFSELESNTMVSMSALLQKRTPMKKSRATERGELLKYFSGKLGVKIPYVAFKVTRMNLQDLYYIKSSCDAYEQMGNPWSKAFYGSLKSHT